jgi:hypothetical protein
MELEELESTSAGGLAKARQRLRNGTCLGRRRGRMERRGREVHKRRLKTKQQAILSTTHFCLGSRLRRLELCWNTAGHINGLDILDIVSGFRVSHAESACQLKDEVEQGHKDKQAV